MEQNFQEEEMKKIKFKCSHTKKKKFQKVDYFMTTKIRRKRWDIHIIIQKTWFWWLLNNQEINLFPLTSSDDDVFFP